MTSKLINGRACPVVLMPQRITHKEDGLEDHEVLLILATMEIAKIPKGYALTSSLEMLFSRL
jgi:hypothetical protein